MNTKRAVALLLIAGLAVAATQQKKNEYYNLIAKRFPDVDPEIGKKAYGNMMKNSANGVYSDYQLSSDELMDQLFLNEVQKLTNRK